MSQKFPSPRIAERRLPVHKQELPVIGWRTWRLGRTADGVALQSVFGNERWDVGGTCARCRCTPPWLTNSHHRVPVVSCGCGLYAFNTPTEAIRQAEREMNVSGTCCVQLTAAGAVVAWGRVVQHGRQGWRAQYARPLALLDAGQPMLLEAARHHRVPLVSWRALCVLPFEYGDALIGG
jgi:hypothetical protein